MAKGRKKYTADEQGGSSWLESYADLITNFLSVFVILYSFAMINQASVAYKAQEAERAAAAAQGEMPAYEMEDVHATPPPPGEADNSLAPTTNPTEAPTPTPAPTGKTNASLSGEIILQERENTLYEAIRAYISLSELEDYLSVTKQSEKLILLRVHSSIFFDLGSAELEPSADEILADVSAIFVKYDKHIRMLGIEGHTDNLPIRTQKYDSNWELSTARAVNVLRKVIEISGLEPTKFSAVGLGEFHPIADNDSEEGRAQNRRVDFIIETYD